MKNRFFFAFIAFLLLALLVVLNVLANDYFSWRWRVRYEPPITGNGFTQTGAVLGEGSHVVRIGYKEYVELPSGMELSLEGIELRNGQKLDLADHMKFYDGGFSYEVSSRTCSTEEIGHEDYTRIELVLCEIHLDIRSSPPPLISYDGFVKRFSSRKEQYYKTEDPVLIEPTPVTNKDPFLSIAPRYIHYYRATSWEPDIYGGGADGPVTIYTAYGYVNFEFSEEEVLRTKASKKAQIGPLTLTLNIENVDCFPPYLKPSGVCGDTQSTVYNRVDFVLTIEQTGAASGAVLTRYEW